MSDCCKGSGDQKECCKAAIEAYKQELSVRRQLREEQKSKLVIRMLAVFLPLIIAFSTTVRNEWDFSKIFWSVIALMCWVSILCDLRKWIQAKKQQQTEKH